MAVFRPCAGAAVLVRACPSRRTVSGLPLAYVVFG